MQHYSTLLVLLLLVGSTQEGPIGIVELVLTEDGTGIPASDNMILRKFLRIPRYFDPGETLLETCFNFSEEGHVAANCPMEKRKKPCFVCGCSGKMQSSARRLVPLSPRDYHTVTLGSRLFHLQKRRSYGERLP